MRARYLSSAQQASFEQALRFVLERIDRSLPQYIDVFPAPATTNLRYEAIPNEDWTASFWTGMVWLAYEATGEERYRTMAERQLPSYNKRVRERIAIDTHDLGFLYSLSAVAAYRLTGNHEAREMALVAAELLAERYFHEAEMIQAWGDLTDPEQRGRMIIDCLMNLPLLYWASEETGDDRYGRMARSHASQSAKYLVREDNTSYHTYYMDPKSGEPRYGNTHQGYADDSCWSRGQAWGIYGFALSYAYTKDETFVHAAKRLADYFLTRLPEDGVVYWDLIFMSGAEQERDSSAAAIAVCGLLELAKQLLPSDPDRSRYDTAAVSMLAALTMNYTTMELPKADGLLLHGVYNKPRGWGIDESTIWGDYFYLEALIRLRMDWRPYW